MSRNDDRPIGGDETERLNRTGRGAQVTGVHGVDAVDVEADQEIPAADRDAEPASKEPERPGRRRRS